MLLWNQKICNETHVFSESNRLNKQITDGKKVLKEIQTNKRIFGYGEAVNFLKFFEECKVNKLELNRENDKLMLEVVLPYDMETENKFVIFLNSQNTFIGIDRIFVSRENSDRIIFDLEFKITVN
jgi:hypothetical protein